MNKKTTNLHICQTDIKHFNILYWRKVQIAMRENSHVLCESEKENESYFRNYLKLKQNLIAHKKICIY